MARKATPKAPASRYDQAVDRAFSEVNRDTPTSVERSGKTGEARRAMLTAIALSKARASVKGKR